MPFDFDRIIDHQLYLATQQCIQPYAQQRRVSSAPATTASAAAGGLARIAGARKSSLGSLVSPWGASSGSGSSSSSSSSSRKYPTVYRHWSRPSAQGYSPVDLFFTAPVGVPVRGGGGRPPAQPARDDSSSSLDHFVTAPVGDFTTSAATADVLLPPPQQQQHGNGSRPGSSDTDNWTFATASGGSGPGSISGLDTTVDLTPSPPPSLWTGKIAAHTSTAASPQPRQQPQSADTDTGPGPARWQPLNVVSTITLQVQDLQRTKRFYERVFGAPCLSSSSEDGTSATLRLNGGALVVTLRESSPDARRGDGVDRGGVLLTVPVDDVGEVCRRLRGFAEEEGAIAGQRVAEPVTWPGGAKVVTFSDPAGHCWQVGQDLEGS
ncbi:hypothetical protein INS49_002336 [Diaporthe citri]|uniref:uncharacterized protein n=1 Tax=Diaporthe citri TaxID=83186 RepID=UPI001C818016|nr:uncharacterized protein INS49_002336 [Diaporthe citri]KAG6368135.1 hypothetical protein INS49_002336 [Diaporthe citri]